MSLTSQPADHDGFPLKRIAPVGAPNVVLVMLDDVGFGHASCFGGSVATPHLDRLAREGLRYNQFHTTALCSPTRASLLTGVNHHRLGFGSVPELAVPYAGYNSVWPDESASIARILSDNGYATAAFGKWHNTPVWETSPFGPFDRWPTGRGFDYFYGFMGADTNQWAPLLFENTTIVDDDRREPGLHLDEDLSRHAVSWVRGQRTVDPSRPFFMYVAPGTAHAPHHAPESWLQRYRGSFDHGWDIERERVFRAQLAMGVVPSGTELTPRPDEIPAWDDISPTQRVVASRLQEAFAAALSFCDEQVGAIFEAIEEMGELENTLIVYVVGDNGPSAEGGINGNFNKWAGANGVPEDLTELHARLDEIGGPASYNNYPVGWAWAGSTPHQWFKQVASHFGGIRNGLVVSWPAEIKSTGEIRSQFHHCVDIFPTILGAAGIEVPTTVGGVVQQPIDGVSMISSMADASRPSARSMQYFEVLGHRGIYADGWMASARHLGRLPWEKNRGSGDFLSDPWELYWIEDDFSQSRDLAGEEPKKLAELQNLWWAEAGRNRVLPLDDDLYARYGLGNKPSGLAAQARAVLYADTVRIPEAIAPDVKGKSHRIVVHGEFSADAEGVLVSMGGRFGGYAVFIQGGAVHYAHNYCGTATYYVSGTLPPSTATEIAVDFRIPVPEPGAGGDVTISVDGHEVAVGQVPRTVPYRYSYSETLDVGRSSGTCVSDRYCGAFPYTARLDRVVMEVARPEAPVVDGRRQGDRCDAAD
ncbi:arylsulfatase [Rhodococcus sp. NPDC057014]|uniref:arylsulfatase n=1 Tax=Rhodococcus sp. NPDC057014 TaxID=3346000 RepID=UPI0036308F9F